MSTDLLPLSPDDLLTTTRSLRRRLDLTRPVDPDVVMDCLRVAVQAPSPVNIQPWSFVVVTDPDLRAAIAERYRRGWELYDPLADTMWLEHDAERQDLQRRIWDSVSYLAEHFQEVPVHLLCCVSPRPELARGEVPGASEAALSAVLRTALYGSVIQAGWSFQLAARVRGLGTCWTNLHLFFEEEVARLLGIPYDSVAQVGLIAVAHARGTRARPAPREPLETKVHWNGW
jgi:nitroreductase